MDKLVNEILEILEQHALVKTTRVVNYDETTSGKLEVKIRCDLPKSHQLQIWIHTEPESLDYAYQLFTTVPLLRWDNAPHYEHLSTAPHHFHDERGARQKSEAGAHLRRDAALADALIRRAQARHPSLRGRRRGDHHQAAVSPGRAG